MRAMALDPNGDARAVEIDTPSSLNKSQVLVKVEWSALDTALDPVLNGTWTGTFLHKQNNPLVLGWHFSGKVILCGSQVKTLCIRDKVWGFLQYDPTTTQGSFAEYIVVDKDECAVQPDDVEPKVLAAAATETVTAYQAICHLGGLESGQSILVVGGGGGVGSAAIQIARNLGAHVTAICGAKDVDKVRSLGANTVVDRQRQPHYLQETETSFDVIFDTPNVCKVSQALTKLDRRGTYVATIPSWGLLWGILGTVFRHKSCKFISCHSSRDDLDVIGKWLSQGKLQVEIDSTFDVKDLTKAFNRQHAKNKAGRVVIRVDRGW